MNAWPVVPPDTRAPGQSGHIEDHNQISDSLSAIEAAVTALQGAGFTVPVPVQSSAYAASPGQLVPVSTASAAVTVTLPAAPPAGTQIAVLLTAGTHNITVAASGADVFNTSGGPVTLTLSSAGQGVLLEYSGTALPAAGTWYQLATSGPSGASLPLTTFGDTLYQGPSAPARLAGNTTTTPQFYTQAGNGTQSAAPVWRTIQQSDLGAASGTSASPYEPLLYGAVWGYPWQFMPESYHGAGDGKIVSDGAITSGQATLACTTSAPFASTAIDGGKTVMVIGAGAAGAPLLTTIATVTDSAHAVLAANASTTVTASGVIFGTDNTSAIRNMQADGITYAQGGFGRQEAEYLLIPRLYVVSGAAIIGGATLGNSIFPRPVIAGSAPKLSLTYRDIDRNDAAALPHWLQTVPQAMGACIAVLRLDGTLDATYGPASVFGGPLNGYGGAEGGTFNNIQTVVDGISLLLPNNSTFGGWDFYGDAECFVKSGSAFCMATVPASTGWPQYNPNNISNQWSYALRMPSQGNNARCDVGYWSAYGFTYGFMPSEHTTAQSVRCDYNITGIETYATGAHGARIKYASCEGNINGAGFRDGVCKIDIETLDVESNTTTIYDPSSFGNGTIGVRGTNSGYFTGVANGGLALKIRLLDNEPGPVVTPQAPPTTGNPWFNGYYREAEVTLSISGGSLSALTITGAGNTVSQVVPASSTFYRFTLPSAQSYTPTFTGTLTHTVTLL